MPAWGWVLIAIGVVVVLAAIAWRALAARRTRNLHERFGSEYDRTADRLGGTR
jgi:protein-S-isoprenylcysteine O-methyltransferase Ste14